MRFIKITASLLVYASTAAAMRRAKPGLAAGLSFQLSVNDSKVWSYKAVER